MLILLYANTHYELTEMINVIEILETEIGNKIERKDEFCRGFEIIDYKDGSRYIGITSYLFKENYYGYIFQQCFTNISLPKELTTRISKETPEKYRIQKLEVK